MGCCRPNRFVRIYTERAGPGKPPGRQGEACARIADGDNGRDEANPYSPQAANASLNARSPGAPFSIAMMARRWLT